MVLAAVGAVEEGEKRSPLNLYFNRKTIKKRVLVPKDFALKSSSLA